MPNDSEKQKIPPVADRLVYYVEQSGASLFVDQNGEAHAFVNGEALPISRANRWLTGLLYEHEGKAPTNDGLVGAKRVLDMLAHRSGEVRELHTRAAFYEGAAFYQLGPDRVVRIDEEGYRSDPDPPVTFRSVKNLRELPDPKPGKNLLEIASWVNLKTDRDKRLFVTYVTLLGLAHIPRPILETTGIMGSGKSTACRFVKRAVDPTSTEAVTIDRREFLQKASHCYVVMLDNQNSLPEWALDTLCRLVTGESDSKRVLYTDDEDLVWSLKRAVLLNGINPPSERSDVRDRTLPIELERIHKGNRLPEDDYWMQFDLAHPEILGAIFDALSGAIKARHTTSLTEKPRLADWGVYAAALYESQGWGVEQFVADWKGVEEAQHQGTLDGSVVAQAIILYMHNRARVEETASKLHDALERFAEDDLDLENDRGWPKTGRTLWKRIREVTPLLEAYGIKAGRCGSNKIGRPIVLEKIGSSNDGDKKDAGGGDDKGDDIFAVSSPENPHGNVPGDDNGAGGRYFGATISSDKKEEGGDGEQGESNPDLSSPSSPNGAQGAQKAPREKRRLTTEEAERVQRLISEGMKAEFARAEVLGEEA